MSNHFDVIVIGGGASGMISAGRAASRGRKVLLLEKNISLGKKLLISGGGRCNVTNNKPDVRTMVGQYKGADQFLFSAFTQVGVTETIELFKSWGVDFIEENAGRLFPSTHKSSTIYDALVAYMHQGGVDVRCEQTVTSIRHDNGLFHITTIGGGKYSASSLIVSCGGLSHPETGSTGDGFRFMKSLGHIVNANSFSLVPIATQESWSHALSGVTLDDIKISILLDGKAQYKKIGRVLFTHTGLSGPTILNMSKGIGELLPEGVVQVSIDLYPTLDVPDVKKLLHDTLTTESNKKIKNALGELVPSALVAPLLLLTGINPGTFCHSVRTEERVHLVNTMKSIKLTVASLLGSDKAIISSGGVSPSEISWKTMESKILKNLYITGDMIDIDRPSGGYSLQLCWTTGLLAGSNA